MVYYWVLYICSRKFNKHKVKARSTARRVHKNGSNYVFFFSVKYKCALSLQLVEILKCLQSSYNLYFQKYSTPWEQIMHQWWLPFCSRKDNRQISFQTIYNDFRSYSRYLHQSSGDGQFQKNCPKLGMRKSVLQLVEPWSVMFLRLVPKITLELKATQIYAPQVHLTGTPNLDEIIIFYS